MSTLPIRPTGKLLYFLQTSHLCNKCRKEALPPPEKRFEKLFQAARTLFRAGVSEEDQIISTLVFANDASQDILTFWAANERLLASLPSSAREAEETREDREARKTEEHLTEEDRSVLAKEVMEVYKQQAEACKAMKARLVREKELLMKAEENAEAWESKVDRFALEYRNLRPVKVVDEVLIVERLPISVNIARCPNTKVPEKVLIQVYGHPRPAKAEHVRTLYENALSTAGISYGETEMEHADMRFSFVRPSSLYINIGSNREQTMGEPYCPHPYLVQEFYRMLLGTSSEGGFGQHLITRQRGGAPEAYNLIPACIAFYLKVYLNIYGEKYDRKTVHQLLNNHVLCEVGKTLPEGYSSSAVNQLWRDVEKVAIPLIRRSSSLHDWWYQQEIAANRL